MYVFFINARKKERAIYGKNLTVKPPVPKPKCCNIYLVQPVCSIEAWTDCQDAWAEIMKV